jgi:hypothetical protein
VLIGSHHSTGLLQLLLPLRLLFLRLSLGYLHQTSHCQNVDCLLP